jgi:hypothetical protein
MSDEKDRRMMLLEATHISDAVVTAAATPSAAGAPAFVPHKYSFDRWLSHGKVYRAVDEYGNAFAIKITTNERRHAHEHEMLRVSACSLLARFAPRLRVA